MPELFGSSNDFQQWFACTSSLADAGSDAALLSEEETLLVTNRLHQVLRPFILRRLKESVAVELPQKVGQNMSPAALLATVCKAGVTHSQGTDQLMHIRYKNMHAIFALCNMSGSMAENATNILQRSCNLCLREAVPR